MSRKTRIGTALGTTAAGLAGLTAYDLTQKKHSILRNFPILGHGRYTMELIRPMIQQYFVEPDTEGRPFDRVTRTAVYERAKNQSAIIGFGTERDVNAYGYESLTNSFTPLNAEDVVPHVKVGGPHCTKPYQMSIFNISAMSFGALSERAVLAMNKGAAMGGFAQNTGEGGLTPYHLEYGADIIWELGTGYFGAQTEDGRLDREKFKKVAAHDEVKMIAIKISQGAKPGTGGHLPKEKITPEIAKIRDVPRDKDCISPAAHLEFSTPRELIGFIKELRELSDGKPIGIKFCVNDRVDVLAICKAMLEVGDGPDFIDVDGSEGGTGAAPSDFADFVGMPLTDGLMTVHNALVGCGLRDQVTITAAGKITNARDIIARMIQGADVTMSARGMMMATGCIQTQRCHTDKCPVGVATQDKRLQRAIDIDDKATRVYNYQRLTVDSVVKLMAAMGARNPKELTPSMLHKRVNSTTNPSYAEIYDWLDNGALLSNRVPEKWNADWVVASPDHFGRHAHTNA